MEMDKKSSEEERYKTDLLIALENSRNFATTHSVIEKLKKVNSWSIDEKETLYGIAMNNSQVFYILGDFDVISFYKKLLKDMEALTKNAKKVQETILELESK